MTPADEPEDRAANADLPPLEPDIELLTTLTEGDLPTGEDPLFGEGQ